MKSVKEVKTEVVKKEVDEVYCDICGREIKTENRNFETYFDVTTHHSDWGNDSIDSYEYYEICSNECLKQHQDKWLERYENSNTACYEIKKTNGKGYIK